MEKGESYSPSMRFDIHPYFRVFLAFCWRPFELLGRMICAANMAFSKEATK